MFRPVILSASVSGRLLLHSMPGRCEPLENVWVQAKKEAVRTIVCLAEGEEIRRESPEYARAIEAAATPCPVRPFEIPDRGVPEDRPAFWALAGDVAEELRSGHTVLIHCGAGIGRTGTLAVGVLLALGETATSAVGAVSRAQAGAETGPQRELISWCASQSRVKN